MPADTFRAAFRGTLRAELEALGFTTLDALRASDWREVCRHLAAKNPRRRDHATAMAIYAAMKGKRPSELSERQISAVELFIMKSFAEETARQTRAPIARVHAAMNDAMNREARRLLVAAGRAVPIERALPPSLAAALSGLGIRDLGELRRRGWDRALRELAAKAPARATKSTAQSLYAASSGIPRKDVAHVPGALDEIEALMESLPRDGRRSARS